jgi:choline-sulfatase
MSAMKRRDFNKNLIKGIGAAALAGAGKLSLADDIRKKPNIVFICSDQHSYKYSGYMGHPFVSTPNLDKLAANGTVFTNTYCGNPVCVPGRTSMMTGMYASDCNSFCNSTVWDGSHPLWAKRLQEIGYYCWATGKLDLNDKYESGFIEVETRNGHFHNPDITSLFRRPVGYRIKERGAVDGRPRKDRHGDNKKRQLAINFLQNKAPNLNQPWVLYTGFLQPHPKFEALEEYYNMYYPNCVDMPMVPDGHLEELHLVNQEIRHFKRIATPIPNERIRRARAGYFGMITELDEYVGSIFEALRNSGQLENTIFIYTSDHGETLGEHGLWYKNNLYDNACRVPLIITGPGIPKGFKVNTPVGHVDLVASILEWAEIQQPQEIRGHSLSSLMEGKSGDHPGYAFCETHSEGNCTGSFMIRKGDWKYIRYTWYDDLLFNIKDDPNELVNLIDSENTSEIKIELREILNNLLDPEEVTIRAFNTQESMLKDWAKRLSENDLFDKFKGRLGDGQARSMAKLVKDRYRA